MDAWPADFPSFDEQDLQLAENQGALGYHFVEWLAAIVLYHATGYLSLVSKYEFPSHRRKQEIVQKLLPADVLPILRDRTEHGRSCRFRCLAVVSIPGHVSGIPASCQ